jgi:hypothetical protein
MKKIILLLIVLYIFFGFSFAQEDLTLFDAKSAGLGFTFVTLNSEGETYFFNPATLSLKKFSYLSFSIDSNNNQTVKISYFYPSTTFYALSVDLTFDPNTQQYTFKNIRGAISFPLTNYLYFGTSANYIEEQKLIKGNLGILLKVGNIKTGVVGEGITIEKLSDNEYKVTTLLKYSLGLNLSLFNDTTNLYLDVVDIEKFSNTKDLDLLRFGLEQNLGNILVIRLGSSGNITDIQKYTLGIGLNLNLLNLSLSTFLDREDSSNLKLKYKLTGTLRF